MSPSFICITSFKIGLVGIMVLGRFHELQICTIMIGWDIGPEMF